MKLSEGTIRRMLNLFPPLFFNRIRIRRVAPGFREMEVRVRSSLLNRNLQRTIFGGTLFSAADPCFAIMYWQIFAHAGWNTEAWLKEARIEYFKPADSHLTLHFVLTQEEIDTAKNELEREGRFSRWHSTDAVNDRGEVVARIHTLVYLRMKDPEKRKAGK